MAEPMNKQRLKILARAIKNEDVNLVRSFMQRRLVDPNGRCPYTVIGTNGISQVESELLLEIAVNKGNLEIVDILVNDDRCSADPNKSTKKEKTVLMQAIDIRNIPIIKCLFEGKLEADANLSGQFQTPLELAVFNNDFGIVDLLLSYSADINLVRDNHLGALGTAAANGNKAMVEFLLEKGADANDLHLDTNIMTVIVDKLNLSNAVDMLKLLVECGVNCTKVCCKLYTVKKSLRHEQSLSNLCNFKGVCDLTPLHISILRGNVEMSRFLIAQGTVHASTKEGYLPLHLTCCVGKDQIVKDLLKLQDHEGRMLIDIDGTDLRGSTALHIAVRHGYLDIVKLLLHHGANPNIRDNDGTTILHIAALHGDLALFEYLLEHSHGCDLMNVELSEGIIPRILMCFSKTNALTPIMIAAKLDNYEICQLLIKKGAQFDNNRGMNVLHLAARDGGEAIICLFLDQGCDINEKCPDGKTPLIYATEWENRVTCQVLLERGALLDEKDSDGFSALNYSIEMGGINFSEITLELLSCGAGCTVW